MTRRKSHIEIPVTYAAVGATKRSDLLRFPPEGTTPFEEELRLGSGQERFVIASSMLMTWGAQRGAGLAVESITPGDGGKYSGITFGADGAPTAGAAAEDQFSPSGEAYLTAGTTATLEWDGGKSARAVRVVYTIDDERRIGFAWGTADEQGVTGEELFLIEHRSDDSVWAVGRGFLVASEDGLLGMKGRSQIRDAVERVKAQLGALAPGVADSRG